MTLSHEARFIALSALLNANRDLIRERPFTGVPVAWEAALPELSQALRRLTMAEVARYENAPLDIPGVRDACPALVDTIETLTTWPHLTAGEPTAVEMPKRIRNRKWSQILHFIAALDRQEPSPSARFVDWCSGKGHLAGELNRRFGRPVTCIEKNPALCRSGAAEAEIRGRTLRFECKDVLVPNTALLLDNDTAVTALHACGHLNLALIRYSAERKVPYLAVAPCCYQRIDGMIYRPISRAAEAHAVPLTRHLLRLPALSDHRPSALKHRFRQRQHAFRLGIDLLIREATGQDAYRPLGKIRPELMRCDFETFARTVSDEKGVPLPGTVDFIAAEQAGWRRFHLTSALGLARSLFARALESWLLLDRMLFLEEQGYTVTAGEFCAPSLTPRNLMIIARS